MIDVLRELGLEFQAEDFDPPLGKVMVDVEWVALRTNAVLREKLKGATRVYTNANEPRGMETTAAWSAGGPLPSHTHTGLLICIEEMKK